MNTVFEDFAYGYFANAVAKSKKHYDPSDRKVHDLEGVALAEGPNSENPYYPGFIVFFDHEKALNILTATLDNSQVGEPLYLPEEPEARRKELARYTGMRQGKADHITVYDTAHGIVWPVKGQVLSVRDVKSRLEEALPRDFYSMNGSIDVSLAGGRTIAAVLGPARVDGVDSIVLNTTPVGAGIGRMSHIKQKDPLYDPMCRDQLKPTWVVEDLHAHTHPKYHDKLLVTYRKRNGDGELVPKENETIRTYNQMLLDEEFSKTKDPLQVGGGRSGMQSSLGLFPYSSLMLRS